MKTNKTVLLVFTLGSLAAFAATPELKSGNTEETQSVSSKDSSVSRESGMEKDNTGRNQDEVVTAQTQSKGTESDVELTRKLRQKIVDDDSLSANAHNIKIITVKGAITLKGPVASKSERVKLENLARSLAGNKKVYNRLTY